MNYLCQLGNGKMLVEDNGNVSVKETGYPYPDCEYNGIKGQFNILDSLGVIDQELDSSYLDVVTSALGDSSNLSLTEFCSKCLEINKHGIPERSDDDLEYDEKSDDYFDTGRFKRNLIALLNYTHSPVKYDVLEKFMISHNIGNLWYKDYGKFGFVLISEAYISNKTFNELVKLLGYDKCCCLVKNIHGEFFENEYENDTAIIFNLCTPIEDVICGLWDRPYSFDENDGTVCGENEEWIFSCSDEKFDERGRLVGGFNYSSSRIAYLPESKVSFEDIISYLNNELSDKDLCKRYKINIYDLQDVLNECYELCEYSYITFEVGGYTN